MVLLITFNTHCSYGQSGKVLYENSFSQASSLEDFQYTDQEAWRWSDTLDNQSLELFGKSNYEARVRSPFNIALLKSVTAGSFVLEVDLKQTGREYGHRDMCLFFGMKDPTNFYYVHIATKADQNAHNIFIVNDEPRRPIGIKTTEGIDWGSGWNKVRLERDVETGTILVYFNDMNQPIMEAKDTHFVEGYIGFGSFDDTGMIDNIKIWGTATEKKGLHFFNNE